MSKYKISTAMMNRLPLYLDYLNGLKTQKVHSVSATILAKDMGLGEVLVRKELGVISGNGRPKVGYRVEDLISDFDKFLQVDKTTKAVIIGAGKLGKALMGYKGFKDFGVEILAGFDIDPAFVDNKKVFSVSRLKKFVSNKKVEIGIITVPAKGAEDAYKSLLDANIKGIWNFSPVRLEPKEGVVIRQENLALSLAHLNIKMREMKTQEDEK